MRVWKRERLQWLPYADTSIRTPLLVCPEDVTSNKLARNCFMGVEAVQFYRQGRRKISLNNGKRHKWVSRQSAPSITTFRWRANLRSLVLLGNRRLWRKQDTKRATSFSIVLKEFTVSHLQQVLPHRSWLFSYFQGTIRKQVDFLELLP